MVREQTINSEAGDAPHHLPTASSVPSQKPGTVGASVEKKHVLVVFPTRTCLSQSSVFTKNQHHAQFHRDEEKDFAMARAVMGLRACPLQWVTRRDSNSPSSGPGRLCPRFAASQVSAVGEADGERAGLAPRRPRRTSAPGAPQSKPT